MTAIITKLIEVIDLITNNGAQGEDVIAVYENLTNALTTIQRASIHAEKQKKKNSLNPTVI
jgi:hypothetical protein